MPCHIILTHPRSGSSELTRALRLATGQHIQMEPFARPMIKAGIDPCSDDFLAYVGYVLNSFALVKHMWHTLSEHHNTLILNHPQSGKILFLQRRNTLAAALSRLLAIQTGQWDRSDATKSLKPIDIASLEAEQMKLSNALPTYRRLAELSGKPVRCIDYEDIYGNGRSDEDLHTILASICSYFDFRYSDEKAREAVARHLRYDNRYNGPSRYSQIPNIGQLEKHFGVRLSG
jgi:LPS sulfotransferase NodH